MYHRRYTLHISSLIGSVHISSPIGSGDCRSVSKIIMAAYSSHSLLRDFPFAICRFFEQGGTIFIIIVMQKLNIAGVFIHGKASSFFYHVSRSMNCHYIIQEKKYYSHCSCDG